MEGLLKTHRTGFPFHPVRYTRTGHLKRARILQDSAVALQPERLRSVKAGTAQQMRLTMFPAAAYHLQHGIRNLPA